MSSMDMFEFGRRCRGLNEKYKMLFGYIPVQSDYDCTREEFIEVLKLAITEEKEIDDYLVKL